MACQLRRCPPQLRQAATQLRTRLCRGLPCVWHGTHMIVISDLDRTIAENLKRRSRSSKILPACICVIMQDYANINATCDMRA